MYNTNVVRIRYEYILTENFFKKEAKGMIVTNLSQTFLFNNYLPYYPA